MIFKTPAEFKAWSDNEAEKVKDDMENAIELFRTAYEDGEVVLENPGGDNWHMIERDV